MNKAFFGTLLLACATTFGGIATANAAETRLLYGTATGPYAKFYDVVEEANRAADAQCRSLSGTPAHFFTITDKVREGDNVTVTVSKGCTI